MSLLRGKLQRIIIDGSKLTAEIELLSGETMTGVEYLQEFGFASLPPKGSDVIVGFIENDRNNATILRVEHPDFRPTLADGEAVVYDNKGKLVKLETGGNISANAKILSDSEIETSDDITAAGDIETTGGDVKTATVTLDTHVHGGVTTGAGVTGVPQ